MMTLNYKKYVKLTLVFFVVILLVAFVIANLPKPQQKGTSKNASFDIASGELLPDSYSSIVDTINTTARTSITIDDLVIQPATYVKSYDSNNKYYSLGFVVDIQKIQSSLAINIDYNSSTVSRVSVGCAEQQKQGYMCNIPEYLD